MTPEPADTPPGKRPRLTRRWAGLALLAICGFAVLHGRWLYAPCDDAYIFFVYAKNLVEGNGLTFNGEAVWGFTSTLWVFLLSGIGVLGIPIHTGAEVLSQLTGCFALWATYRLGRALGLSRRNALLSPLLLAATGDFAFYIGNGLEQVLFLGLLALATAMIVSEDRVTIRRLAAVAVVMAAATLTRPEGVLLCGLLLIFWATRIRRPYLPVYCGLFVTAIVVPVHALLVLHYSQLLPNTYYVKCGAGFANLRHGLNYIAALLPRYLPLLALLGYGFFRRRRAPSRSRTDAAWLAGICFVWVCYILYRGGDNLVGGRVFLPVVPFLCVAAVRLLRGLTDLRLAGLCLLVAATSFAGYRLDEGVTRHAEGWRKAFRVRRAAADHLRENYPPDTVVALNPAGVIPYITGMESIDMLGLNNWIMAQRGKRDRSLRFGHQVGHGGLVLKREPDVILFVALSAEPGPFISDREIWASPEFHEQYVPVRWTGIGTAYVRKKRLAE